MKSYTLLVWENIPDNVQFYLIPDDGLTVEDHELLAKCQGQYINHVKLTKDAGTALNCINAAITEQAEYLSSEHPAGSPWAQRFTKFRIEPGALNKKVSKMIVCGFLL